MRVVQPAGKVPPGAHRAIPGLRAGEGPDSRAADRRLRTPVSVIIPALEEEVRIAACLDSLASQEPPFETVVVDGGSSDATCELARERGARVLAARRGRAEQMNAGARAATGDILLFLHADTLLPHDALRSVREAVATGIAGGAFHMRYDSPGAVYRLAAAAANLYCRFTGDCFGDRAIFATREAFERVRGYRPLHVMEDLDFTSRLRRRGFRLRLLPGRVTTSARRFGELGIVRGGWWALKLCRAYHRHARLDLTAERFYAEPYR
jgi:rSAM/selenodomain-associated transferase 2